MAITILCPNCAAELGEATIREVAKAYGSLPAKCGKRGRPRTDHPRCPCGANTRRLAARRNFRCCREAGIGSMIIEIAKEEHANA